jgi:hypothetical protein
MTTKHYYYSACSIHFIINKDEASAIQNGVFHFEVRYHPPDIAKAIIVTLVSFYKVIF